MGDTRSQTRPLVSVVVIGLNEQERLQESLEAVFAHKPPDADIEVIYVDSGSTDRSVLIAGAVPGVQVLHLPGPERSAAKARNFGLQRTRGEFVQLVDGDSVLQRGWMDAAMRALLHDPSLSCVFGQCIEMAPDQSIYMRVCGLDWHIPAGEHRLCGGNALWRKSVIAAHGYFDESLKAGEEPDLCYRVRQTGGKIVCLDVPMVTHDLGMRRFAQYWRRAESSGKGYARIASRYWFRPEKLWLRELLVNFAEPLAWLVMLAVGAAAAGAQGAVTLLAVWWAVRTLQIAYAMRGRRLGLAYSLLYGVHCQFGRLPVAIGQLKSLFANR
jgi:glycosyltransferase involved in cell wall biosynthesis